MGNKGTWEKGDVEFVKIVYKGKVIKDETKKEYKKNGTEKHR